MIYCLLFTVIIPQSGPYVHMYRQKELSNFEISDKENIERQHSKILLYKNMHHCERFFSVYKMNV